MAPAENPWAVSTDGDRYRFMNTSGDRAQMVGVEGLGGLTLAHDDEVTHPVEVGEYFELTLPEPGDSIRISWNSPDMQTHSWTFIRTAPD